MKSTNLLSASFAGIILLTSPAFAADPLPPIEPIGLGDSRLSCDALIAEAGEMQTILGGAPEGGIFGNERMINAGSSLAMQGALNSGLGGQAVGAIGFLGRAAKAASKRKAEAEAARKQSALRRWYFLVGMYRGKDCDNQPVLPQQVEVPDHQD